MREDVFPPQNAHYLCKLLITLRGQWQLYEEKIPRESRTWGRACLEIHGKLRRLGARTGKVRKMSGRQRSVDHGCGHNERSHKNAKNTEQMIFSVVCHRLK